MLSRAPMNDLRPMQLGEIVDRSASFWRAHWKRLWGLFFVFSLAQYILLKGGEAWLKRLGPGGDLFTMLANASNGTAAAQQPPEVLALMVGMIVAVMFGTLVMTTAAAHWVMPTFLGEPAKVVDGVTRTLRRLGTLTGLFVLALLWAVLVLAAFMVPGGLVLAAGIYFASGALAIIGTATVGLGMIAWGLWFFLRFALWGPVVAVEDVGAFGAFRRCDTLTSGRVGKGLMGLVKMRLMVLITVVMLLLLLISLISGAPIFVLRGIYGNLLDPSAADVPAYLMVPAELLNLAVSAVMYPLYVAFQTLFYADMRMRREGLDLEVQLQRLPA
jgi:hypothetical protein